MAKSVGLEIMVRSLPGGFESHRLHLNWPHTSVLSKGETGTASKLVVYRCLPNDVKQISKTMWLILVFLGRWEHYKFCFLYKKKLPKLFRLFFNPCAKLSLNESSGLFLIEYYCDVPLSTK